MARGQLLIDTNSSERVVVDSSVRFMLRKLLVPSVPLLSRVPHSVLLGTILVSILLEFSKTSIVCHCDLGRSLRYDSLRVLLIVVSILGPLVVMLVLVVRGLPLVHRKTGIPHSLSLERRVIGILVLLVAHGGHRHLIHRYN